MVKQKLATTTNRAFQQKWFGRCQGLQYDNVSILFFCVLAIVLKTGKMKSDGNIYEAFVHQACEN